MSSSILESALQTGLLEKIITFLEVSSSAGGSDLLPPLLRQTEGKQNSVRLRIRLSCGLVESRNLAFVSMYAKIYVHLSCNLKSCLMDFTYKVFNDHQLCDSGILSVYHRHNLLSRVVLPISTITRLTSCSDPHKNSILLKMLTVNKISCFFVLLFSS